MLNPQELVATLKSQHAILKSDLTLTLEGVNPGIVSPGNATVLGLTKFKTDLVEHLGLEDGTFYPDYLDKKTKRGEETETTKDFINQMKEIGKTVIAFLDKYSTPEAVEGNIDSFRDELTKIVGVLKMRIESEEEGVYDLYLLY